CGGAEARCHGRGRVARCSWRIRVGGWGAAGPMSPSHLHRLFFRYLAALDLAVLGVVRHGEALALAVVLAFAVMGRALAVALALTVVRPFAVDALHRLALAGESHRGGHQGGERSRDRQTPQTPVLHV